MADTNLLSGCISAPEEDENFRVIKFSSEPWANALAGVVVENYNRLTGHHKPDEQDLMDNVLKKVTLVTYGENMLGASLINAREGKLFAHDTGFGILPKGARTKGYRVDPAKVLDILPGFATAEAQTHVSEIVKLYPDLRNLTLERLHELPQEGEEDEIMCSLAVMGEWRMPDCTARDAIWLVGEYWREDDICDRSVLLIRPQYGISEHGSVYGQQLLRNRSLGEIVDFQPIPYRKAIQLCEMDFDEAAQIVFDSVSQPTEKAGAV